MFILSEIQDLVQIHPSSFRLPTHIAIEEELNRKYANRIIHELGLGIKVFEIKKVSDPIVHSCQDGSYQQNVIFTLIVFKPFEGEIMLGIIKECDINTGVRVHLNFFEDIYIPPPYLIQPSEFDREEGVWFWTWEGERLYMDPGNWIRFRVENLIFKDVGPITAKNVDTNRSPPFTVLASIAETGLGLLDWWVQGKEDDNIDGDD